MYFLKKIILYNVCKSRQLNLVLKCPHLLTTELLSKACLLRWLDSSSDKEILFSSSKVLVKYLQGSKESQKSQKILHF